MMGKANIIEDADSAAISYLDFGARYELNEQTAYNRRLVANANRCGCFYCGSTFGPSDIEEWLHEPDGEDTAICPYCGVDAVIVGSNSFPLSTALLSQLYMEWFEDEFEKVVEEGNCIPEYLGEKEFLGKGIPFCFSYDPHVEIVGSIDLFAWKAFDAAWYEEFGVAGGCIPPCEDDKPVGDFEGDGDEESCYSGDEEFSSVSSVSAYFDEEGYFHFDLINSRGVKLPYEPWTGKMQDLVLDLTKQYGDRLKGLTKKPWSNCLHLFVRHEDGLRQDEG